MTFNKSKYEVLSPAGSYECMVAAFNGGADAVYVGGSMFGARAFAGNFNSEELLSAIDYAHLRGKKLFLTVNTLLKNQELKEQLFDYIKPLYEAGLDAVIVQDMGVLSFVSEHFPHMDIHASTQMTVTGSSFAKELKKLGVARIVPARELSYREIKKIYDETGLEIECFVHGALCYSYSGQCLLSSIIGGRSGNRGRCAQPCRLPYDVVFDNQTISKEYPLSPKDLCTLENLPDILEAGVYSLKIEGRMKKPEYVAIVTAMYRKYVDMYEQKGKSGYSVNINDIEKLKDIYNRGGFTDGYYMRHNGTEMMSLKRPNHMGTEVAQIMSVDMKKRTIKAKAVQDIDSQDVLEIFVDNGQSIFVRPVNMQKGREFVIQHNMLSVKQGEKIDISYILKKVSSCNSMSIMRTRNNLLIKDIEEKCLTDKAQIHLEIGGSIMVYKDVPVSVDIWSGEKNIHLEGDIPQPAGNRPITDEDIRKQFLKTGGTDFVFDRNQFTAFVEDGLFINIKELNCLRREALSALRAEILSDFKRDNICINNKTESYTDKKNINKDSKTLVSVLVSTEEQFNATVNIANVDIIYAEMDIYEDLSFDKWNSIIEQSHGKGKEIYMALPYITRVHAKDIIRKNIQFFKDNKLDGYMFRNMETVALFKELFIDCGKIVFDNTIYSFNDRAIDFYNQYNPYLITASYELNGQELKHLDNNRMELCVYGYIPVMVSAGCIKKSYNKCDKKQSHVILKDRLNNEFLIINHCRFCYNIIYNSKPLMLNDILKDKISLNPAAVRFNFVNETAAMVREILGGNVVKDFTRGHFKRGV